MIIDMVDLDYKHEAVLRSSMRLYRAVKQNGWSHIDMLVSNEYQDLCEAIIDVESTPGHQHYKYPEDRGDTDEMEVES